MLNWALLEIVPFRPDLILKMHEIVEVMSEQAVSSSCTQCI